MPSIMLTPGEFAIKQTGVDWRHFRSAVILLLPDVLRAEQSKNWPSRHRRHVAALLVQPIGVATFWHSVTDECKAGRTQSDQFMSINGEIPRVFAAKRRFSGAVLQEIPRHPMIFS